MGERHPSLLLNTNKGAANERRPSLFQNIISAEQRGLSLILR